MRVSAARQLALVPDVDACALSPLGVEFKKVIAGAGAPPDRDLGSDAANRHPASPLVASALGAIIRGNRVREWGELFSVGRMGVGSSVCVCVCVEPGVRVCVCEFPTASAARASSDPPRASCGLSPMRVSAARQLALVPDVDACALSPLGVEFKKVVAGAGAPPDRDLGSDAANRHPASPLVASALGAIKRGNRVREWGELFSVRGVSVGN
jgi:hypothetical protein